MANDRFRFDTKKAEPYQTNHTFKVSEYTKNIQLTPTDKEIMNLRGTITKLERDKRKLQEKIDDLTITKAAFTAQNKLIDELTNFKINQLFVIEKLYEKIKELEENKIDSDEYYHRWLVKKYTELTGISVHSVVQGYVKRK